MAAFTPTVMAVKKRHAAFGGIACSSMAPCGSLPAARAIGHRRFTALWVHPDLIHRGDDGIHRLPALVATVTGDNGFIEGVQRIWLDPKRPAKGPISLRPRKAFGRVHGQTVCFGGSPSGAPLLTGKGIETALSLITAASGIHAAAAFRQAVSAPSNHPKISPCWSSLAIKTWKTETPRIVISTAVRERGIPPILIVPDRSDLNDDLIAFGEKNPLAWIAPFIASTRSAATVEERRGSGRIIIPS